jgi:hypothetical protein
LARDELPETPFSTAFLHKAKAAEAACEEQSP